MEKETKMRKGEMLNNMLVLCVNAHDGQYDKGGQPYILHPLKVMHWLKTDDEELQCIALGHDLLEDTKVTMIDIYDATHSVRVVKGIEALTKRGDGYEAYKKQVVANPDACKVKMCDLRHNSDIRRLKGVTEEDHARIAKYHKFYMELLALQAEG